MSGNPQNAAQTFLAPDDADFTKVAFKFYTLTGAGSGPCNVTIQKTSDDTVVATGTCTPAAGWMEIPLS
jgi:hypothetical protein